MSTMTDFDLRLADHATRIARVNQQGWLQETFRPAGVAPAPRHATSLASIRQRMGLVVVRAGQRLQGTSTGRIADRAAV
jgi:hypothetical protein